MVYVELVLETKDQKGNNHVVFFSVESDEDTIRRELFDNKAKYIEVPSPNGVVQGVKKEQIAKYTFYPSSVVDAQKEKIQ